MKKMMAVALFGELDLQGKKMITFPVSAVISSVTPPSMTTVSPIPLAALPNIPINEPAVPEPGIGASEVLDPTASIALATPLTAPPSSLTDPPAAPAVVSEATFTANVNTKKKFGTNNLREIVVFNAETRIARASRRGVEPLLEAGFT